MRYHQRNLKRASATIEVALLMPLLIGIMLLVIYLSFSLYNREAITTIAYTAALKGAQMEQHGQKRIQEEIGSYVERECKKLLFIRKEEHSVKATMGKVRVTINVVQKVPFCALPILRETEGLFQYGAEHTVRRMHPSSIIQEIRHSVNK